MKILITGGTGLIGSHLCGVLIANYKNIDITILTRNITATTHTFNQQIKFIDDITKLESHYHIIINLAGEPINKGRWTTKKKALILSSRINVTQKLVEYIKRAKLKPELFVSGSAIGFYGSGDNKIFTENSIAADDGFAQNGRM